MPTVQIDTRYKSDRHGTGQVTARTVGLRPAKQATVDYDHALGHRTHEVAAQRLADRLGSAGTVEYVGTRNDGGDTWRAVLDA